MAQVSAIHISAVAAAIVRAFERNDGDDYFTRFASECTIIFAPDNEVHHDRDSWQAAWRRLRESGWRVEKCTTLESGVQVQANGGVFWHVLETTAGVGDQIETYRERETIVFEAIDGELLAVHEHLSPVLDERTTS